MFYVRLTNVSFYKIKGIVGHTTYNDLSKHFKFTSVSYPPLLTLLATRPPKDWLLTATRSTVYQMGIP